jgi:hypothetical protein
MVTSIKANSTIVDIQDGHNLRKGHWTIEPNLKSECRRRRRDEEADERRQPTGDRRPELGACSSGSTPSSTIG